MDFGEDVSVIVGATVIMEDGDSVSIELVV